MSDVRCWQVSPTSRSAGSGLASAITEASPKPTETPTLTSVSRKARSAAPAGESRPSRSAIILFTKSRAVLQRMVKASALSGATTSSDIIAFASFTRTFTGAGVGTPLFFAAGAQAATISARPASGAARGTNFIGRFPQQIAAAFAGACRRTMARNMVRASPACPVTSGRAWRAKKGGPKAAFSNPGCAGQPAFDAVKMQSIVSASFASNSASLWRAERPSVRAREKLAIMFVLHDSLAFASSRL